MNLKKISSYSLLSVLIIVIIFLLYNYYGKGLMTAEAPVDNLSATAASNAMNAGSFKDSILENSKFLSLKAQPAVSLEAGKIGNSVIFGKPKGPETIEITIGQTQE